MRYLSFVVRLWVRDHEDKDAVLVRGHIEHIQTSASSPITQLDSITAFIQVFLHPLFQESAKPPSGDPD
jgi:hypothetical protein